MTVPIIRAESDGVLKFTFNRPEKLNAINREMVNALIQGVSDMEQRRDLRVMLVASTGRYFSSGSDLAEGVDNSENPPSVGRQWLHDHLQHLFARFERLEKPIVVAHQAMCMGGGLELSLSCDFRLASEEAAYSLPEIKMGLVPLSNGVSKLTRLCGPQWAKWMILAQEPIDAQRAHAIGLVQQVYPAAEFEERVEQFCLKLARQPPEAMAIAKIGIDITAELGMQEARQVERLCYSSLATGQEGLTLRHEHFARVLKDRR